MNQNAIIQSATYKTNPTEMNEETTNKRRHKMMKTRQEEEMEERDGKV